MIKLLYLSISMTLGFFAFSQELDSFKHFNTAIKTGNYIDSISNFPLYQFTHNKFNDTSSISARIARPNDQSMDALFQCHISQNDSIFNTIHPNAVSTNEKLYVVYSNYIAHILKNKVRSNSTRINLLSDEMGFSSAKEKFLAQAAIIKEFGKEYEKHEANKRHDLIIKSIKKIPTIDSTNMLFLTAKDIDFGPSLLHNNEDLSTIVISDLFPIYLRVLNACINTNNVKLLHSIFDNSFLNQKAMIKMAGVWKKDFKELYARYHQKG